MLKEKLGEVRWRGVLGEKFRAWLRGEELRGVLIEVLHGVFNEELKSVNMEVVEVLKGFLGVGSLEGVKEKMGVVSFEKCVGVSLEVLREGLTGVLRGGLLEERFRKVLFRKVLEGGLSEEESNNVVEEEENFIVMLKGFYRFYPSNITIKLKSG